MALTEEKRAQILDAAVEEFQSLGFAGTSMDRIAQRAKVSKRTVYNHFDGKESLFRAILDLMVAEANVALDVTYDPGRPIEEQLYELGWAEGKLLTSPPFMRLARMAMGETMRDPALAAEMAGKMEKMAIFGRFIEAAHKAGALNAPDWDVAAEQFVGLIKTRGFWPKIFAGEAAGQAEMDEIVRQAVSVFLKSYAADPA